MPIPDELVPADAHVEMEAKKAAGYYARKRAEPQDVTTPSAARSTSMIARPDVRFVKPETRQLCPF